MSARAREAERRRRLRADRLARQEREWIIGHPEHEDTTPDGKGVAWAEDTAKLGRYFATRCIARYAFRRAMIAELERLLLTPAPAEAGT